MTDRELMQQALEALEEFCEHQTMLRPIEKRDALRERLAQPEQWEQLYSGMGNPFKRPTTRDEKIVRPGVYEIDDDTQVYRSELEAAVRAEREACARVCEAWGSWIGEGGQLVANAIRARGQA